jgi:hypothetical protein
MADAENCYSEHSLTTELPLVSVHMIHVATCRSLQTFATFNLYAVLYEVPVPCHYVATSSDTLGCYFV